MFVNALDIIIYAVLYSIQTIQTTTNCASQLLTMRENQFLSARLKITMYERNPGQC